MIVVILLFIISIIVILLCTTVGCTFASEKNANVNDSCTNGDSPQCSTNQCTSDADCPSAGGVTCCFCNLNTNTCGNPDTCSSCMASCTGDNCCQDCASSSSINDCSHAGC